MAFGFQRHVGGPRGGSLGRPRSGFDRGAARWRPKVWSEGRSEYRSEVGARASKLDRLGSLNIGPLRKVRLFKLYAGRGQPDSGQIRWPTLRRSLVWTARNVTAAKLCELPPNRLGKMSLAPSKPTGKHVLQSGWGQAVGHSHTEGPWEVALGPLRALALQSFFPKVSLCPLPPLGCRIGYAAAGSSTGRVAPDWATSRIVPLRGWSRRPPPASALTSARARARE